MARRVETPADALAYFDALERGQEIARMARSRTLREILDSPRRSDHQRAALIVALCERHDVEPDERLATCPQSRYWAAQVLDVLDEGQELRGWAYVLRRFDAPEDELWPLDEDDEDDE